VGAGAFSSEGVSNRTGMSMLCVFSVASLGGLRLAHEVKDGGSTSKSFFTAMSVKVPECYDTESVDIQRRLESPQHLSI